MTSEHLTFLQEAFDAIRDGRKEGERVALDATGLEALLMTAAAARTLRLLGDFNDEEEWKVILVALYALAADTHNLTPFEVQDVAITLRRMQRDLSELEAA